MVLTVEAASHFPCDSENFTATMIAFEMLITGLTKNPIQINGDFFIEEIDWVGASNLI